MAKIARRAHLIAAVTAVMLTVAGLDIVPAAATAAPAASTDICASNLFVLGVAGTNEVKHPPDWTMGTEVDEVVTRLTHDLPGVSLTAAPVQYAPGLLDYATTEPVGYANALSQLRAHAYCGNQRIDLVGYSQGAQIVGDLLTALSTSSRIDDRLVYGRLAGAVMLGDPRFNSADSAVDLYRHGPHAYSTFFDGMMGYRPFTALHYLDRPLFPPSIAAITASYCLKNDVVCQYSPVSVKDCLKFSGTTVIGLQPGCPHFQYGSKATGYTRDAGTYLAGVYRHVAALPLPLLITTTSLPPGQVGVPYAARLTANGGTGSYRWSVAHLPIGLTINAATGGISGIPTLAGTYLLPVTVTDQARRPKTSTAVVALDISAATGGGGGSTNIPWDTALPWAPSFIAPNPTGDLFYERGVFGSPTPPETATDGSGAALSNTGAVSWTVGYLPQDPAGGFLGPDPVFDTAGNMYAFYIGAAVTRAVVSYSATGALRWVTPIPAGASWNYNGITLGADGTIDTIQDGVNDGNATHLVTYNPATGQQAVDHTVGYLGQQFDAFMRYSGGFIIAGPDSVSYVNTQGALTATVPLLAAAAGASYSTFSTNASGDVAAFTRATCLCAPAESYAEITPAGVTWTKDLPAGNTLMQGSVLPDGAIAESDFDQGPGTVTILDPATGDVRWTATPQATGADRRAFQPRVDSAGQVVFAYGTNQPCGLLGTSTCRDTTVWMFDGANGTVLASTTLPGVPNELGPDPYFVAFVPGEIYLAGYDYANGSAISGHVWALPLTGVGTDTTQPASP